MQVVYDFAKRNYSLQIGVYNCRRISGSQTYSQHSWSNAIDIYTANKGFQDRMAAELKKEFGPHIRNILTWRYNAAHWNHIHVSMWPKGLYTPPCKGGALRVKHKDGTRGTVFTSNIGDDDLSILSDNEQKELQKFLAELRGINSNVSFVKYLIPWFRKWRSYVPQDFMEANADLTLIASTNIDDEARIAAAAAHMRLDKLHNV